MSYFRYKVGFHAFIEGEDALEPYLYRLHSVDELMYNEAYGDSNIIAQSAYFPLCVSQWEIEGGSDEFKKDDLVKLLVSGKLSEKATRDWYCWNWGGTCRTPRADWSLQDISISLKGNIYLGFGDWHYTQKGINNLEWELNSIELSRQCVKGKFEVLKHKTGFSIEKYTFEIRRDRIIITEDTHQFRRKITVLYPKGWEDWDGWEYYEEMFSGLPFPEEFEQPTVIIEEYR